MRSYPAEIYFFVALSAISLIMTFLIVIQDALIKTALISQNLEILIFAFSFVLGVVIWVYTSVTQEYKTSTSAIDYKYLNRAIFVLFAFASSLIAYIFVDSRAGSYFTILLFATFLPTYFFEIISTRREHEAERAYIKKHGPFAGVAVALLVIYILLDVYNELNLGEVLVLILGFAILLPTREIRKENEIKILTFRILSPLAASALIFLGYTFYLATKSSGSLFFFAVMIVSVGIMVLLFRHKYRSLQSGLITAMLVVLSLYATYVISDWFNSDIIWSSLLLIFTFWVYGFNYRTLHEGTRNVSSSFDLMGKGKIVFPAILVVGFLGIAYGNGTPILSDLSSMFSSAAKVSPQLDLGSLATFARIPVLLSITALGLLFMVNLGFRRFNPFLFSLLLIMFYTGVSYILSIKVQGVWTLNAVDVSTLSIIVTAIVFYEPVYRFIRSYTARVPSALSLGRQLGSARFLHGRYDVSLVPSKKNNPDFLGAGGFAYVFKGKDVIKDAPVVLKVPRIYDEESKSEWEKRESLKESIKQLEAESRVLSEISFPGVVAYIEYFRDGGQHYLVEEYADGKNLNSYLATKGKEGTRFQEDEIVRISLNLLFSVNYLHLHEIFHRDLNPGNIVITKKIPKIIDFGTSKHLASRVSASFFTHSERIGVPCYHPPELDSEEKIKASSTYDTYSIGALMCSLITGKFLDNEEMREKYGVEFITRKYLDTEVRPLCIPKIFDIIVKATSLKPSERYKSAFHFIGDFLNLSGDYLITDLGYICKLDHEHKYPILSVSGISPAIFGDYMIYDRNITLSERGRQERSRVGTIEYDNRTQSYVVYPYGKRNVYQQTAGSLSQKVIRSVINEGDVISLRPDLRDGTFTYHHLEG